MVVGKRRELYIESGVRVCGRKWRFPSSTYYSVTTIVTINIKLMYSLVLEQ